MSEIAATDHVAVVYQPLKTDITALKAAVKKHEQQTGCAPTRWYKTAEEDAGAAATEQAISEGAKTVIASGGDGTVRAIAEVMRGSEVPLAIVPQGTGNLLARNIGAPINNVDQQFEAAFYGERRKIDLGVAEIKRADGSVDEHVFLVLAGMGLDARAISLTNPKLKKSLGWLAYVDAGMRSVIKDKPLHVRASYDKKHARHVSVYTVMIGNCGLLPGNVLLIPEAKLDDGLLDVVALKPIGKMRLLSWVPIMAKLGWENGVLRKSAAGRKIIDLTHDTKSVVYRRVKQLQLQVANEEAVQLDGDDFGHCVALTGRVDPGALTLCVMPQWSERANVAEFAD